MSGAVWSDLNSDGFPELLVACEWGPVKIFRNSRGRLSLWDAPVQSLNSQPSTLNRLTGLWTSVTTGDVDSDGRLDITDPIAVLEHLFRGSPLGCVEAGNADDDSRVDITDAIRLLMFLFGNAAAPPDPGPPTSPCGHDRTWSTPFIPCRVYEGC